MRDVISIHLGQAGVQMGLSVWELFGHEHNISANGELQVPEKLDFLPSIEGHGIGMQSFYRLNGKSHYTPRAILVDLEPTVIESISRTKFRNFFQNDCIVKENEDAANNFARGFHTVGRQKVGAVIEAIRSQAESSGRITGFMQFHSMGGGTGSGLGTLVAEHISNHFCKTALVQVAVFPSPKTATAVVEPYNTILAAHYCMEFSKCVVFLDNEAVYNICQGICGIDAPSTPVMNNVISQAISSMTTGLRFDCQQTADFNDFHTNLIPYPRLHFPVISLSPVVGYKFADYYTVNDITSQAFEASCRFADFPSLGTHIACCLLYRGEVSPKDINDVISNMKRKKIDLFPWVPTGFKIGMSPMPPHALSNGKPVSTTRSVFLMSNNTGLRASWINLAQKYQVMLSKGAFIHWYLGEGMEYSDFQKALEDIKVLINEYHEIVKN